MKITNKDRITHMLNTGAIGGEWYDPLFQKDWPDTWDGEVVRIVVDAAIMASRPKPSKRRIK